MKFNLNCIIFNALFKLQRHLAQLCESEMYVNDNFARFATDN